MKHKREPFVTRASKEAIERGKKHAYAPTMIETAIYWDKDHWASTELEEGFELNEALWFRNIDDFLKYLNEEEKK